MEINVNDLTQVIGELTVENRMLRKQVEAVSRRLKEKEKQEAEAKEVEGGGRKRSEGGHETGDRKGG
jgi:regulator of replication initiation timing